VPDWIRCSHLSLRERSEVISTCSFRHGLVAPCRSRGRQCDGERVAALARSGFAGGSKSRPAAVRGSARAFSVPEVTYVRFGLKMPSRPREFHPEPLTDSGREPLDSSGSCHRTKAATFR
jgi:hypothetical protein